MYYGISGAQYTLDSSPIKSGGEGNIYAILGNQSKFAKIYHPNVLDSELEANFAPCTETHQHRKFSLRLLGLLMFCMIPGDSFVGFL